MEARGRGASQAKQGMQREVIIHFGVLHIQTSQGGRRISSASSFLSRDKKIGLPWEDCLHFVSMNSAKQWEKFILKSASKVGSSRG